LTSEQDLKPLNSSTIQFGPPKGPILLRLDLKNVGEDTSHWILYTGRGALKSIRIWRLDGTSPRLVLDSLNKTASRSNLQSYHAFSSEFSVKPGEKVNFAILFDAQDSTFFPLQVQSFTEHVSYRSLNVTIIAGSLTATFVLILLNVMFFQVTLKSEFIWLGLAELSFILHTLHVEGYTTIFLFPNNPETGLIFGNVVKCTFAVFMSQFARSFVSTPDAFPKIDTVLKAVILIAGTIVIFQPAYSLWSEGIRQILFVGAWVISIVSVLFLPIVGVIATRSLGLQFTPLILAWGSLALFVIYGAMAASGLISDLPVNKHLAGPVGLFQALMATFALGLHIRKIQSDKAIADEELTDSMRERLEISERANRLSAQNAMAVATINDQNSLLHASGHDSRQVISALKSAVHFMSSKDASPAQSEATDILKASADYLENIVQTTMSGSVAGTDGKNFLALSGFAATHLTDPLGMIYGRVCRDKGLALQTDIQPSLFLISDRALLMRAVSNYLSNSLKFTRTGSVKISMKRAGPAVNITISDTGSGMTAGLAKRLNDGRAKRIKADEGFAGTGSGFSASKQIITLLGGRVTIALRKSGGCRVSIDLPLAAEALTPCTAADLRSKITSCDWADLDAGDAKPADVKSATSLTQIAFTYDNSPQTRGRAAQCSDMMLLKPLYLEMADHPALTQG